MRKRRARCVNCDQQIVPGRFSPTLHRVADGLLCDTCFNLGGYDTKTPIQGKSRMDIKTDIANFGIRRAKKIIHVQKQADFQSTREFGPYIEFDEVRRKFLVPPGHMLRSSKVPRAFRFEDVLGYEFIEDGGVIARAGAAMDRVTLYGEDAAKKKARATSLQLKISVNDPEEPQIVITLIDDTMRTNSIIYKLALSTAKQIIETFDSILGQNGEAMLKVLHKTAG